MIKREDVEALLAACEAGGPGWYGTTDHQTVAALCQAWLSIQDAPEVCVWKSAVMGEGWEIYGTKDGDIIESLPFEGGQRVRIVKEAREE